MGDYHTRIINGIEYAYDGDTRIGKLYDTFGHEETLNVFGPNVKIKDGAGFSDKREAEIDGQKGVFVKSYRRGRETEFKPDEPTEETEEDDIEERNVNSPSSGLENKVYSGGYSYTPTKVTSESKKNTKTSLYETFGYFAELFGAHKLAREFFSGASEVYLFRGNREKAAFMADKGGNFKQAISYYLDTLNTTYEYMAEEIAIKNNLGSFLVKQYEMVGEWKKAADIAYKTGMLKEAMELYYNAGLIVKKNEWASLNCFEDAGRIAESLGLEDRAIEIYEFGGERVRKYPKFSDPVSILRADNMIDKAKELRKKKRDNKKDV